MRTPTTGSVVRGTVTLVPDETGGLAPSEIGFTITGPGLAKHVHVVAVPTWYGPIGYWNSTHVPNGIYRIRAYAQNAAGVRDSSSSVSVRVSN